MSPNTQLLHSSHPFSLITMRCSIQLEEQVILVFLCTFEKQTHSNLSRQTICYLVLSIEEMSTFHVQ